MELYIIKKPDPTRDCRDVFEQLVAVKRPETIDAVTTERKEDDCYIWIQRKKISEKKVFEKE